jgi:sulfite exporter TauE/SafE
MTPFFAENFGLGQFPAMFAASLAASSVAISLSHPFDTMKTVLQGDIGEINKSVRDIGE